MGATRSRRGLKRPGSEGRKAGAWPSRGSGSLVGGAGLGWGWVSLERVEADPAVARTDCEVAAAGVGGRTKSGGSVGHAWLGHVLT